MFAYFILIFIYLPKHLLKTKKNTMKKVPYFLSILFLSTLIFSLGSCNKEDNSDTFQTVLDKGGVFDDPMNSTTKSVTVDTVVNGDSLWACTTETYSVVQGMQEFPLFNPNSSVIYPGNLLQGGSLKNASPDVIVVDRAGGTFSIDILEKSLVKSLTLLSGILQTCREASGYHFFVFSQYFSSGCIQISTPIEYLLNLPA